MPGLDWNRCPVWIGICKHVRDDAGHGSGAITDCYIDVNLKERHRTAKDKPLQEDVLN